jgi:hypothetical protein
VEAESRQELEQLVGRAEPPADQHGDRRPEADTGPAAVHDMAERLEDGHGHHRRDESVGRLVELEHPVDEPCLVEDRRTR